VSSFVTRMGLALARPRAALAIGGNREHAGRSGSDLLLAIVVLVLVTQARALVMAWRVGVIVEPTLGLRAVVRTLTDVLAVDLGFLVLGSLVIWAAAGRRRELGRAADLSCVAVLPLLFVELIGTVVFMIADIDVPRAAMTVLSLGAYTWTGVLVALGALEARSTSKPATETKLGKPAGVALAGIALVGVVAQGVWITRNFDQTRPVTSGDVAPTFVLSRIEAKGQLGARVSLDSLRGKVVVLDFWATWCQPCLRALPTLDAYQRKHPEVAIVTVNLDDAGEARAIFDERGYALTLLASDGEVTERYNVSQIPHTVVIDKSGVVRHVSRGSGLNLEREIAPLR
jgi:thiol-disulfide isomerase/thioredoxin